MMLIADLISRYSDDHERHGVSNLERPSQAVVGENSMSENYFVVFAGASRL